jgi:hypothetical protein
MTNNQTTEKPMSPLEFYEYLIQRNFVLPVDQYRFWFTENYYKTHPEVNTKEISYSRKLQVFNAFKDNFEALVLLQALLQVEQTL